MYSVSRVAGRGPNWEPVPHGAHASTRLHTTEAGISTNLMSERQVVRPSQQRLLVSPELLG